ncbi:MAG: S41 family peptidase [Gemmataceae bacterium]
MRLLPLTAFLGAGFLGAVLLCPGAARAANAGDRDQLRRDAEAFERQGEWDRAGEIYLRMLADDRSSALLRKKVLLCARHVQLINRHRDHLYLERVRGLTVSQALNAYLDALGKLQANYVDRLTLGGLYDAGLEEFGFALNDAAFRQEHLPDATPEAIANFARQMREEWGAVTFRQPAQVRQTVREIAAAAQQKLGLKPSVAVLEFVCGACNALDEQTAYLPPSDEAAALQGQLAAAGAILGTSADGHLFVARVVPNTWASSVGLKDGERVEFRRGDGEKEDSSLLVEIDVYGRDESTPRALKLPTLTTSVAEYGVSPEGVGFLRLTGFLKNTPQELEDAVQNMKMQGLKALILDLRGNPGGLFAVAVQVAERFIPEGIIVSTQGQAGPYNRTYSSHSGMAAWDMPLFVLVDGDTASAAEMLAGALKENRRAVLIGQPTYGKGTMQQVLQLAAGGGVRITLARFFAPNGQAYNGVGVSPQFPVSPAEARDVAHSQAVRALMMRP